MIANDPNDPEITVLQKVFADYVSIYQYADGADADWEMVQKLYRMDDVFFAYDIAPPLTGYKGWDEYKLAWRKVLGKYSELHFDVRDDLRIFRKGDVAWLSFSADWWGISRDGAKFAKEFRQTMVWVKEAGEWRAVQEHGSSPRTTTLSSGEVI